MDTPASPVKSSSQNLSFGRIPFWLKQKSLISVSSHTLRPGGLALTGRAVELCDFTAHDKILDLGCGYGMTLNYLFESHGIRGTGVDPDPGFARQTNQTTKNSIQRIRAGLPDLPFLPGTWNGIFCECVLSLAPDPSAWLRECHRLLAANGKLIITDLYIRKWMPRTTTAPAGSPQGSCAAGARTLMEMMACIEEAGLKIDIIEDHSRLLSQLGTPCRDTKTGYCMILAGKYR